MAIQTQRIPLVGSLINRNANPSSFATKDQLFVNCYPEIVRNPITAAQRVYLYKRLGYTNSAIAGLSSGSFGGTVWSGKADGTAPILLSFVKSGGTNTQVFNGTSQVGGDIATTNNCLALTETMVSTTSNLVGYFVNSGSSLYEAWFFPESGAWTKISDADFPPNLGTPEPLAMGCGPAFMDGYMFVMTTNGKVWNSDLNSVSAWTANSYITAQSSPDGGVGVARYKNLIVAFGAKTIEFFQNTGNPTGSPLTVVANATIRIGASNSVSSGTISTNWNCILPYGDTIYWIGVDGASGRKSVYRLNGFTAQKVSTPYIDKLLNELNGPGAPRSFAGAMLAHGMSHIVMVDQSGSIMYCYCVDTDFWWQFTSPNPSPSCVVSDGNTTKLSSIGSTFNGTVAQSTFTDSGAAFTQTVQTEPLDFGTMRRKSWLALRVVGDIQSSTSNISISWSDDDYATFSTPVTIDMSSLADMNSGISRLGQSRRRAWKLTHAANTPNRMEAIEITFTVDED